MIILVLGYHMIVVAGFNIPNFHRKVVGYSAIFFILLLVIVNILDCLYCFV